MAENPANPAPTSVRRVNLVIEAISSPDFGRP
jgi:hypothetical protein